MQKMSIEFAVDSTGIALFVTSLIASSVYLTYFPNIPWLPKVPIQEANNTILGLTTFADHKVGMGILRKHGPVAQYAAFGKKVLFIADKELAKSALKDIHGKGFFHNSNPKLNRSSIFSSDTGPIWAQKRGTFRKAFSTSCLKAHMSTITQLSERMLAHLNKVALKGDAIPIDEVFTQLTIGVICEVAFELDSNAFEEGPQNYGRMMDTVLKELFKVTTQ